LISAKAEIVSDYCFYGCKSLDTITFENESKLRRIGANTFLSSELKSILIPANVKVSRDHCFAWCSFLESSTLKAGSRWQTVATAAFIGSPCSDRVELPRFGKTSAK
jgi:hypothetical protein